MSLSRAALLFVHAAATASLVRLETAAAARSSPPTALARLRGGEDDAGSDDAGSDEKREIIARLNEFPAFCILNGEDQLIGLPNEAGGHDVCWYVDAAEAKEILALAVAGNPEDGGLHLGCTPLGNAFLMCHGWPGDEWDAGAAEAAYKLKGPRAANDAPAPALRERLAAQGFDPGCWTLAVFCHDDFQSDEMMPFFMSAEELRAGWVRNGRPVEDTPGEPMMMDLRLLVAAMRQDAALRAKARLVPTPEAYALSQELLGRAKGEGEAAEEGESEADE